MNLRRFNERGLSEFSNYLDRLGVDSTAVLPATFLTDSEFSAAVADEVEIEARVFSSRMDMARYLDKMLSRVTGLDFEKDIGLWAWLTLFYFDQACPIDKGGHRKAGERARYIPAIGNYKKYYRHLLAGPYRVYRVYRDNPDCALILLFGPIAKPGEIVEQIVARQEVITNPKAVEVATKIYFDVKTGKSRRGAASKGGGSARRLADVLAQFDVTWDLYWMSTMDILAKLPKEFDKFKNAIQR